MKTRDEIVEIFKGHKEELRREFFVTEIGLFGSYAHGAASPGSDIDVLVTFEKPVGFVCFMRLAQYLEGLLQAKVDLVTKKALKPRIASKILKETVFA